MVTKSQRRVHEVNNGGDDSIVPGNTETLNAMGGAENGQVDQKILTSPKAIHGMETN